MEKLVILFKQFVFVEFNGGKVLDMDIVYIRDVKYMVLFVMRELQFLELKVEVFMFDVIKLGILLMNLDIILIER